MNIFRSIKRRVSNLFPKKDIEQALGIKIATSLEMLQAQELWRQMFYGRAPWNNDKVKSKRTASAIAAEFARVCTVEFESKITGSPRADWLNKQYQPFIEHTAFQIMAGQLAAGGELILKPSVNMNNGITTVIIENNKYFPVRYNNDDELMEFITKRNLMKDEKYYTLLEHNNYDEFKRRFEISYYAFKSDNPDTLGIRVPLSSVGEWADLNDIYPYQNVRPWFVHIKTPVQNDVEQSQRNGVSVYSKAVDAVRELDELAELTNHEFKAGRLRQNVSIDMVTKDERGNYKVDSDLFLVFENQSNPPKQYIDTYNPPPRIDAYSAREQRLHREIEFLCQMSYGMLSDMQAQDKTATEVKFSKERFYNVNLSMQKTWQQAFDDLIAIWDEMATVYNLAPQGVYEVSYSWGDSILADRVTEFQERLQLQGASVLSAVENRAWYLGVSEEEAAKGLPGVMEE